MPKKRIGIIGATGSIGRQAVQVIKSNPDLFDVVFISSYSNEELLSQLSDELCSDYSFVMSKPDNEKVFNDILNNESLDIILHSASGVSSARCVYNIVKRGINLALANKESIVTAGSIIMNTARQSGAAIIPVDSEHSAIFQCLMGQDRRFINRVTLTASGGPFRIRPTDSFNHINISEASHNPNWNMGKKICVDSASMMNKGLELIEARYLFDITYDQLDVVIHPESIVHSFVSFSDGSVIAQMAKPDMRVPISFALNYPVRITSGVEALNLAEVGKLTFEPPDLEKFPCFKIALEVLKSDSNARMIAMNAANEAAVNAFLDGKISFNYISCIIQEVLAGVSFGEARDIDEACEYSRISYEAAGIIIDNYIK